MSDKPELYPWRDTGFTTVDMLTAAQGLREQDSELLTTDGKPLPKDKAMHDAITALCVAADHIERVQEKLDFVVKQFRAALAEGAGSNVNIKA